MTYRAEAVIPIKENFPTLRTNSFTLSGNDELLGESLDLNEGRREKAMIQLAYYHQKLKQGYDANVKLRPLAPREAWTQLGRTIPDYFSSRNRYILLRRLR